MIRYRYAQQLNPPAPFVNVSLRCAALGEHEPHILLGRDILNKYRLVLDGPALALEINRPATLL